jgi:hypothetical protein
MGVGCIGLMKWCWHIEAFPTSESSEGCCILRVHQNFVLHNTTALFMAEIALVLGHWCQDIAAFSAQTQAQGRAAVGHDS